MVIGNQTFESREKNISRTNNANTDHKTEIRRKNMNGVEHFGEHSDAMSGDLPLSLEKSVHSVSWQFRTLAPNKVFGKLRRSPRGMKKKILTTKW